MLKYRMCDHYGAYLSSGLLNSATFVNTALNGTGIFDSSITQVVDANQIDKEVHLHHPDIIILEAYWAPPSKIHELSHLHPKIKWVVRSHSNLPFFATERNALKWTWEYLKIRNLQVSANNLKLIGSLRRMTSDHSKIAYLPNYYPITFDRGTHPKPTRLEAVDVGCFGALRPLKNQVNQAMAAMLYADNHHMRLRFHINSTRTDGNDNSVLLNLRAMFDPVFNKHHRLVEHEWLNHGDFMELAVTMDIGMQVSYTETFNIVTADLVECGIPVVVSDEIDWVARECHAHPNSVDNMSDVMDHVVKHASRIIQENKIHLREYSENSLREWTKVLKCLA